MRNRQFFFYLIVVVGLASLFATCKNTITEKLETPDDEEIVEVDTPVIEFKEIDDYSEAMPKAISISNQGNYQFSRLPNKYQQSYFRNPFDSTIYVSGTFCELRGNHFHGGLDIRTGGREGWPVLASADGYVERIKVSTKGYGKVLYIRHTNGYTTVYGHLQQFTGAIANYVKEAQYKQREFEIELFPPKNAITVTKGQQIALSGNTGGSGGPHLHFEIRNPAGIATNPLLHGLDVEDKLPPVIKNVSIYLKDNEKLYAEGNYPYMVINRSSAYLNATQVLSVKPGTYSFGVHTDDYFTDRNNRLGINYCWLTTNGYLLYNYQIERFSFPEGRYINTHTDPYLEYRSYKTFIKLFKEKFNPLKYYQQNSNGEVWLKHGDSVQMRLYVQDYAGLTDSVSWIMVGDTNGKTLTIGAKYLYDEKQRVIPSKSNNITYKNWQITVPRKAIYHPFDFKLKELPQKANMASATLQMHYNYTPLHSYVYVKYKVPEELLKHGNKICAFSFYGTRRYYEGGVLQGNQLSFKTRSLGQYAIGVDDVSPTIRPVYVGKTFKLKVSDNLSGVDRIICSLDGKWILAEYEPKTNTVFGEIPNWIKSGEHQFKLIVIDERSNRAEYNKTINL
jgi:murein DD-endopeptidase MepM/ murein hydrolase activator NlpD